MWRYIARRILQFVPTLVIVSILAFSMTELTPGDAASLVLGREASGKALEEMRHAMGLDRPFLERLASWFGSALRGDLGESLFNRKPVVDFLAERTMELDWPLSYPEGIRSLGELSNITAGLLERDHSEVAMQKILGGNLMRLFGEVWV